MVSAELEFDPYLQWLNVAPGSRPPSPYQILGLRSLESDANLIRLAYIQQDSALSRVVLNPTDRAPWERIRRELDAAYALLTDPERKAVLDASLRRKNGVASSLKPASGGNGDGAAAPGAVDGVTCCQCQRPNPTEREFCGGCGQPLWDKCPKCGGRCAAEERFCGACGANVAASWEEERRRCEMQIEEGLALAAKHHFDPALRILLGIAQLTDPRLKIYAARAVQALEDIEKQHQAEVAQAKATLELALKCFSVNSFEKAQSALEETPHPLRTKEHDALLERARSCRQEILTLGGEIRTLVEEKRVSELAPKLERLLALRPNHTQAMEIATQLRDRSIKSAKLRLSRHEYQEAFEQLTYVPSVAITDEVEKLRDTSGELAAIFAAVQNGALAEPALVRLAEKLCTIAPSNEKAAKLRDQLVERAKKKPASPRLWVGNWAPLPTRTYLDAPVDVLAYFSRAKAASDKVAQVLAEHPCQFFTALGLALQAFERAAIDADITPRDKSGVFSKLTGLGLGRRLPSAGWGIDLDETALKAIKLSVSGKDEIKVEAAEFIGRAGGPAKNSGPAENSTETAAGDAVRQTLATFVERTGEIKGVPVCVGLPGSRVLGRFCELPPMPAKKVPDSVQYEARHQLPIDLEELCWSYSLLDPQDGKVAEKQPRPFMLQACREAHVRGRIAQFKEAGIPVDCVQNDCLALHNAIVFEFSEGAEVLARGDAALATIDFNATGANLVVSSARHVWFRSFGSGSTEICRELMREEQLTLDQAEDVLRRPHRARRYRAWVEAVEPYLQQLANEVQRSLVTYRKSSPNHPIKHVYGLGASFNILGLLRHLRTGK
ncbi:MAG TPA: pilus assembly protein PilM [Pirellulaceae bacterium]|jgi:type IV pilus assembly protein PilM